MPLFVTPLVIPDGAGSGKVLTSDGSGGGSWQNPSAGSALTPTAKTGTYTAAANDAVIATSGSFTVTSPAHSAGRVFSVANKGTGVVTVTAASGVIRGPGLLSGGSSSILLGLPGSYAQFISDGTDWYIISGGQETGWIALTPGSGWASSGGIAYRISATGLVHLKGRFSTVGTNGTTAFTLPAGARPGFSLFPVITGVSNGAHNVNMNVPAGGGVAINYAGGTPTDIDIGGSAPWLAEN